MRVGFVTWNIRRKEINLPLLNRLLTPEVDFQVVQLIEAGQFSVDRILEHLPSDYYSLNLAASLQLEEVSNISGIKLLTNLPRGIIFSQQEDRRILFSGMRMQNREILWVSIHFPSRLHLSPLQQNDLIRNLMSDQVLTQQYKLFFARRHYPSQDEMLIFGDFNVNPYELGMIHQESFHAGNSQQLVMERFHGERSARALPRLYNPMWSILGDFVPGTGKEKLPGSYYYGQASMGDEYFWHMPDGVLMTPKLSNQFEKPSLEVYPLHEEMGIGYRKFISTYSDHFPLRFSIDFGKS